MDKNEANDSWIEYRKLVLKTLDTFEAELKTVHSDINQIRTEYAVLKTKIAFMNAGIAMVVSAAITIVVNIILRK